VIVENFGLVLTHENGFSPRGYFGLKAKTFRTSRKDKIVLKTSKNCEKKNKEGKKYRGMQAKNSLFRGYFENFEKLLNL